MTTVTLGRSCFIAVIIFATHNLATCAPAPVDGPNYKVMPVVEVISALNDSRYELATDLAEDVVAYLDQLASNSLLLDGKQKSMLTRPFAYLKVGNENYCFLDNQKDSLVLHLPNGEVRRYQQKNLEPLVKLAETIAYGQPNSWDEKLRELVLQLRHEMKGQ